MSHDLEQWPDRYEIISCVLCEVKCCWDVDVCSLPISMLHAHLSIISNSASKIHTFAHSYTWLKNHN